MSPASSASSLKPFLARTSLVRGNATSRSPIAVSARMLSRVILTNSLGLDPTRMSGFTETGDSTLAFSILLVAGWAFSDLACLAFFPVFFTTTRPCFFLSAIRQTFGLSHYDVSLVFKVSGSATTHLETKYSVSDHLLGSTDHAIGNSWVSCSILPAARVRSSSAIFAMMGLE